MKRIGFILPSVVFMAACSVDGGERMENVARVATDFAESYINYDFSKDQKQMTAESTKWISFVASNITQEDVDMLNTRESGAEVIVEECQALNDTTCEVLLTVDNYMSPDSIGRPLQLRHDDDYRLTLVFRDGRWQVRMEGLPRSEKHSRD